MTNPTYDYNQHWLRKWLRGEPHMIIGPADDPYLKRWYVLPRNTHLNVYLHKFCRSDDDRALHDHPWDFWSFILKGSYVEHIQTGSVRRKRFSLAHRKAEHAHRVELDTMCGVRPEHVVTPLALAQVSGKPLILDFREKPVWTLFVTTGKRREWGFLCPKKWMHWTEFTSGPAGQTSKGCGEYS